MLRYAVLFLMGLCLPTQLLAKTVLFNDVKHLNAVQQVINSHIEADPGKMLVVFDIDDTLLESCNFVGGDTWYNWQRGRSIESVQGGFVTIRPEDKFTCPFSKLGVLYEIGTYEATEPEAASIVTALQQKFDVMALTSRSPDYRAGTNRELKKAKFNFVNSHLLAKSTALAYSFHDGASTRPITYQDGIVMITGLNKGVVLADLLRRLDRQYATIFFVDDSRKNIDDMDAAWRKGETLVNIFHYTGVDKRISPEDISQSRKAQATFNVFLETTFPDRYTAFIAHECN